MGGDCKVLKLVSKACLGLCRTSCSFFEHSHIDDCSALENFCNQLASARGVLEITQPLHLAELHAMVIWAVFRENLNLVRFAGEPRQHEIDVDHIIGIKSTLRSLTVSLKFQQHQVQSGVAFVLGKLLFFNQQMTSLNIAGPEKTLVSQRVTMAGQADQIRLALNISSGRNNGDTNSGGGGGGDRGGGGGGGGDRGGGGGGGGEGGGGGGGGGV
jgi:hypothetical protein